MSKLNPFVFVVGCPRSGTTLLQRMLNHHPQLAVTNDTHFIPRALKQPDADVSTPLTPALIDRVVGYHRFPRLGVDEATARALADRAPTYSEFVSLLYDNVAAQSSKPFAGEKTPDYVRYLPLLHRLFPGVKSLHIIRDGRDVALSLLDWATPTKGPGRFPLWQKEPLAVSALWWEYQVRSGLVAGVELGPDRYSALRYEDLVDEPELVLRRVSDFLALPFEEAMLGYHVGRTRTESGLSAKRAWLPPTPGLRDWKAQFSDEDLSLFETLVGGLLGELGYERVTDSAPPSIQERAKKCRERWQIEFAERRSGSGTKPLS